MRILFICCLLLLTVFYSGCKKDLSPIEKNNNVCQLPEDTTSHAFTWTSDTLGEDGSEINDIAIISENEVWAGGLIIRKNKRPHTLLKWDGSKWTSTIPPFLTFDPDTSRAPINVIFPLDRNNIYIMNDNGEFAYWDGANWQTQYVKDKDGHIYSIWGNATDNIYLAGGNGAITHYDGEHFTKQTTPTNVTLLHITGFTDPRTGKTRLWASGMTTLLYSEDGETWQIVWDENHPFFPDNYLNPTAVQMINQCLLIAVYYYTNTRLYLLNPYNINDYKLLTQFKSYVKDFDGIALNDLTFAGGGNRIHHYNGGSIKFFSVFTGNGILSTVAADENQVFVAGFSGNISRAIIFHGIR